MKKLNFKIEGNRIYLRSLTESDASERYCSWINDQEVNIYLDSKKITVNELKNYIRVRDKDPNCLFLGIFLKSNREHIGNIKLEPIDFIEKKATLGILVGDKDYWNKGIATEAIKLLISYTFEKLELNEINLGVYKQNFGAIKAYLKTGFKVFDEKEDAYKMRVLNKLR